MDSESPLTFGIAGQEPFTSGISFITPNFGTFKSEFEGLTGDAGVRRRRLGSHSHRRLADGDGL